MSIEALSNQGSVMNTVNIQPNQSTQPVAPAEDIAAMKSEIPEKYVKEAEAGNNKNKQNTASDEADEQGRYEVEKAEDVSPDKIKKAVNEINQKIKPTHTSCQFSYHEKTNRISITVIDDDTKEVIREIPPEKTLDMIAKTLELEGILVDEKR